MTVLVTGSFPDTAIYTPPIVLQACTLLLLSASLLYQNKEQPFKYIFGKQKYFKSYFWHNLKEKDQH